MEWLILLKKFWWAIPMALLIAALGFTRHTLAKRTEDRDHFKSELVLANDRAATTKLSLDGALTKITELNQAAKAAADRLQSDREQAARDEATQEARYERTQSVIEGLKAASKRPRAPCTLSLEAREALESL